MKIKALVISLLLSCGLQTIAYGQQSEECSRPYKVPPRREIRHLITKDGSLFEEKSPMSRASGEYVMKDFPTTGEIKAVVILTQFQDIKFSVSDDSIRTLLNNRYDSQNYSEEVYINTYSDRYGSLDTLLSIPGSARDYFRDQSFGQFTPRFDVIGPVTLDQKREYYGANNAGNDVRPKKMIEEACQKAYAKGLDFSQYDNDGDGEVDIVYVVYAGDDEAQSYNTDAIWAHAWNISLTLGGKKINRYACSGELVMDIPVVAGIGTFVHEFSHVLGLPDFYNTGSTGSDKLTMDWWSVMDYGNYTAEGFVPCAYTAFERYSLGWIPMHTLDAPATMSIGTTDVERKGYRIFTKDLDNIDASDITPADTASFYLIETICNEGWNTYAWAEGLLISQVTYDATAWRNNKVNIGDSALILKEVQDEDTIRIDTIKIGDAYRHYVVPANNNKSVYTKEYAPWGHLFGTANDGFTPSSTPASITQFGITMNKPLTDIHYNKGKTTFHFRGGNPEAPTEKIGEVEVPSSEMGIHYDLWGRPTENPSKGIYIVNGKKVIFK